MDSRDFHRIQCAFPRKKLDFWPFPISFEQWKTQLKCYLWLSQGNDTNIFIQAKWCNAGRDNTSKLSETPYHSPRFQPEFMFQMFEIKTGAVMFLFLQVLRILWELSPKLVLICLLRSACGNTLSALYFHIMFSSLEPFSCKCVFACVPPTFKWWIEMRVKGLLCCGPLTHLCRILLSLINVDDAIF